MPVVMVIVPVVMIIMPVVMIIMPVIVMVIVPVVMIIMPVIVMVIMPVVMVIVPVVMIIMPVVVIHVVIVIISAKERKQLVLVPRRRPVELEAGFDHMLGIERVRVIQPDAPGIGPPILIGRGNRTGMVMAMTVFAARIGQDVIGIGGERRPAVAEVTGYAHELVGIHVVSPHQVRVLVALHLVFIDPFRRHRRKIRVGVFPDQIDNMLILHLARLRGNLRVRHAVQE